MKKITKDDSKRKAELAEQLTKAKDELEEAIKTANTAIEAAFAPVGAAVENVNEVIRDINGFKSDIAEGIQSYIDERSDAWREGDNCSSYETWHSNWEDELGEISIDSPDEINSEEDGLDDMVTTFEELEEEVSL